jgi:hypothetical protein
MSGVAPACDSACQRQKQLDGLKTALDEATATRSEDPEKYKQARLAYYTLLNGQGWLQKEKDQIAKREIEPVLSKYSTKYKALKEEKNQQQTISGLATRMLDKQNEEQDELNFLNKNLKDSNTQKDILNRTTELGTPSPYSTSILYLLYAVMGLLAFIVLYLLYTKRYVLMSYIYKPQPTSIFTSTGPVAPTGPTGPTGGKKTKT